MKKKQILGIITACLFALSAPAQSLYSKAFGKKTDKPVIFIHGGPGGNSVQFEQTTAQKLADRGFYVIVYDRRGEGRSADENAKMTYNEAFEDLNALYKKYNLKTASLIGFSFGGLVTTLFSEKFPQRVTSIILVSSLISQQESYDHILNSVKKTYTEKNDSAKLKKVAYVENLNKNSAAYRGGCFDLASENGYFKVARPDKEAREIYEQYEASTLFQSNIRNKKSPELFYKNEKQNNIDIKPVLNNIKKKKIKIFALYGKQDGIFSLAQMNAMKNITGENNFKYLDNCSHYLYADQQQAFLNNVKNWIGSEVITK